MPDATVFLVKSRESLASAEDDLAKGRYNACARNAYYAAFQAAVAALISAGIQPPRGIWGHDYVQAQFSGLLVYRRKLYSNRFRSLLSDGLQIRSKADYSRHTVNRGRVGAMLREARLLVSRVEEALYGSGKATEH